MNWTYVIAIGVLCSLCEISLAQFPPKEIVPYPINISADKTSNLIFPVSIKSVDRGSSAVLAQKANGVENILQVKAGEQNFKKTNLTVITDDGHFYSFIVSYASDPAVLNFSFAGDSSKALIANQLITDACFISVTDQIKSKRPWLHKRAWEQNVKMSLTKLYINKGLLWLEMVIENKSLIPFTPTYSRFFLKDVKEAKRTASQENEITPLKKTPLTKIGEHVSAAYVLVFNPFTVPNSKELLVQVGENGDNRLMTLVVSHRVMKRVRPWKGNINNN